MEWSKRDFLAGTFGLTAAAGLAASPSPQAGAMSDSRLNVKDFGAKGDGKTPDSESIQKALDAAGRVQGTVWFPAGVYRCHDLRVSPHTTLLADPVWIFHGDKVGAVLDLDNDKALCLLNITGAFGVHLHGLLLNGIHTTSKPVHGIFLNNDTSFSKKEDTVVIDDCKVMHFSGHGIYLLRIWLFIVRHSQSYGNAGCGMMIHGWDGFVTDNQFSGNGSHGFGCEQVGATVMFTANRVEWNHGYGLYLCGGDAWNVTGNCFDRNWGAGLYAANMTATTVTGNVFRRCGKDSGQLAKGERSCQIHLEKSRGLSVTGNVCLAGRDDGGKGLYTPQVGFIVKELSYSVIANNALCNGYMQEMTVDEGGHGEQFVMKDNVGCAKK